MAARQEETSRAAAAMPIEGVTDSDVSRTGDQAGFSMDLQGAASSMVSPFVSVRMRCSVHQHH